MGGGGGEVKQQQKLKETGRGWFDLEKHFAFYGAYHSNPVNILIHTIFVWPILYTSLILWHFTPPLLHLHLRLPLPGFDIDLGLNFGFFAALFYALFYVLMDKKAGSLAGLLCIICWLASQALAARLGFPLAWKVLLITRSPLYSTSLVQIFINQAISQ